MAQVGEEIAPAEFAGRGQLAHLSEAAVRDRAQRAAHDVARLEGLPSEELQRRRAELSGPASQEADNQQSHRWAEERIADAEEKLAIFSRPGRESGFEDVLARRRAERDALPPIRDEAQRELAAVEEVLASREQLALSALRLAPPDYIVAELGQRPTDLAEAKAWDRGLGVIETYRYENSISDRVDAFGPEPEGGAARVRQRQAIQGVENAQRQLRGLKARERVRERGAERSLEIGL